MKWPPYLLKLRFGNPDNDFSLWLPLFLVWPVALVFFLAAFIILLPFALLAMVFTLQPDWFYYLFRLIAAVYRVIIQIPGLTVDVGGKQGQVYIEFV